MLRGGDNETVVRQALAALRAEARLNELEPLLAFFATFVLDSRLVQQIMRWDMAVLEQSPWYQEIVERGRQEESRAILLRQLTLRFGPPPPSLVSRLDGLTREQLEYVVRQIAEFYRSAPR